MAVPETPRRFVCIHGHFYQPPRENPWLEAVEVQDSAAPYHDWNERVTAEAYAPNAVARLLDAEGKVTALRNNYERVSFNIGPTLLAWMERAEPDVYARIRAADAEGARRFGRGNAIAQVYAHCIMPLASRRDQQTQVRWGIADFMHRFGRLPDGMWLPETAVDRGSLLALAENGIRFTILAPSQAARVRYGDGPWEDVSDGRIDPTRPYRCRLGHGREIVIFFYDGAIAHDIAFGGMLYDGRALAGRLTAAALQREGTPLVHVATDGESYGHHHRFGEMALAAALEVLEAEPGVELTNYAAYLDQVPVVDEVEVKERTAWSCVHGVERWRSNCGCNAGRAGWNQEWRTPLREALEWLKTQLDERFERHGHPVFRDPWLARDAYVGVLLSRDPQQRDRFLDAQARHQPARVERTRIWKLLEMQRYGMLAFTSCGWFFDEPSGIETVQVLTYAARAIQLGAEFGTALEPRFLNLLERIQSNLPELFRSGRDIYDQLVRPHVADGRRLIAHYAMDSLFTEVRHETRSYAQRIVSVDRIVERAGATSLAVGRARLVWLRTEETREYAYAALHLGGHDMHCAVARVPTDYATRKADLCEVFHAQPLSELVRHIDRALGGMSYTLNDVFLAERRNILERVMAQVAAECTADYEGIVTHNRRLLNFLAGAQVPLPLELRVAAGFVLQRRLEQAVALFVAGATGPDTARTAQADAARWNLAVPMDTVRATLQQALLADVRALGSEGHAAARDRALAILDLARDLSVDLDLWDPQNHFYRLVTGPEARTFPPGVASDLGVLGDRLGFRLRELEHLVARAA